MAERADQEALLKRRLARALESGRLPHALVAELFTEQGVGTLITRQLR